MFTALAELRALALLVAPFPWFAKITGKTLPPSMRFLLMQR
jgi:hypothetical protein